MATHNLYSDNSAAIEAVLAYIRRAHRLSADDGDEFSSWARLRLLEDDCAILAKFQGLSKFKTFLTTVIHHLFLDWRNQQWGKWRPSAEARRLGPVAVELERLALRDKIDFEQAAQLLVSKGTAPSIAECDAIWSRLKQQGGREFVNVDDIDPVAVTPPSDPIESEERRRIVSKVLEALALGTIVTKASTPSPVSSCEPGSAQLMTVPTVIERGDAIQVFDRRAFGEEAKPFTFGFAIEHERGWSRGGATVPSATRDMLRGGLDLVKGLSSTELPKTSAPPE